MNFSGGQMYAIIETGGKQYRVEKGDVIDVELLDTKVGEKVEFKNVLFINNEGAARIGNPRIAQSTVVQGELIQEVKGPKEIAFKYKQRKPFRRKVGHRQRYARVKITEIIT
jgi:large subunit ribosomal protein L21